MKKTIQTISVIGLLSLPLSAQKITLEGSTTVLPIAQKAAEVYMKKYPSSNITVKGGGSGIGISSLIEGLCDIANASRAVKEKELNNAAKKNRELKAHIIAMDGIVIIVHPSNQINDINKEALQKIFTGKIKN
ncbi:MAG: substrate-binding domain-containing protein, partial [Elusimicrobiales bacterium]|nr:substrate-binding domain-containing protein [Elusimicrobiales bacterium]